MAEPNGEETASASLWRWSFAEHARELYDDDLKRTMAPLMQPSKATWDIFVGRHGVRNGSKAPAKGAAPQHFHGLGIFHVEEHFLVEEYLTFSAISTFFSWKGRHGVRNGSKVPAKKGETPQHFSRPRYFSRGRELSRGRVLHVFRHIRILIVEKILPSYIERRPKEQQPSGDVSGGGRGTAPW